MSSLLFPGFHKGLSGPAAADQALNELWLAAL